MLKLGWTEGVFEKTGVYPSKYLARIVVYISIKEYLCSTKTKHTIIKNERYAYN